MQSYYECSLYSAQLFRHHHDLLTLLCSVGPTNPSRLKATPDHELAPFLATIMLLKPNIVRSLALEFPLSSPQKSPKCLLFMVDLVALLFAF